MDLRSPSVRYFSRAWRVPERPVRRGSGERKGSSGRYASVRRSGRVVCREGASARRPLVCGATDKACHFFQFERSPRPSEETSRESRGGAGVVPRRRVTPRGREAASGVRLASWWTSRNVPRAGSERYDPDTSHRRPHHRVDRSFPPSHSCGGARFISTAFLPPVLLRSPF